MIRNNQKEYLREFKASLDAELAAGMATDTPQFMEFMRAQFAAYDKAIEADVRAMTPDEFKSKWLNKRMDVLDSVKQNDGNDPLIKVENDGKRVAAWAVGEMLADFEFVVPDEADALERLEGEFCECYEATLGEMSNTNDDTVGYNMALGAKRAWGVALARVRQLKAGE